MRGRGILPFGLRSSPPAILPCRSAMHASENVCDLRQMSTILRVLSWLSAYAPLDELGRRRGPSL